MKISEAVALTGVRADKPWCRPISWRRSGEALLVESGRLYVVPQGSRPVRWTPLVADLTDEWELVSPDVVLAEAKDPA